jgi:hypothetical protein
LRISGAYSTIFLHNVRFVKAPLKCKGAPQNKLRGPSSNFPFVSFSTRSINAPKYVVSVLNARNPLGNLYRYQHDIGTRINAATPRSEVVTLAVAKFGCLIDFYYFIYSPTFYTLVLLP